MLALSFFAAIFSTLVWLTYSIAYISDNTVGIKLSALGIADLSTYVGLVILPIFSLWVIFGYINQYLNMRNTNRNLCVLFKQMKKNMDYTDLIARIMLESEQQIKDGFILNRIDILIADMNELIAEIINRASLCSKDQIDGLWSKVQNGGKWAFGKVIIEISQIQPNFQMRIFDKSRGDIVLAGTILEFCARYQNILLLLEKHDKERVFLDVVETGVFGKVFIILAPLADEIRRHREPSSPRCSFEQQMASTPTNLPNPPAYNQSKAPTPHWEQQVKETKTSIIGKLGSLIKKNKLNKHPDSRRNTEPDPFSMALERSFGSRNDEQPKFDEAEEIKTDSPSLSAATSEPEIEPFTYNSELQVEESRFDGPRFDDQQPELIIERDEVVQKFDEPKFDNNFVATKEVEIEPAPISNTQKTLNDLKKEWEGMRSTAREEAPIVQTHAAKTDSDDLVYPFGGWSDESNYRK